MGDQTTAMRLAKKQHVRTSRPGGSHVGDARPDDGGGELLRNVGQYLPDYMAQHPRRQPSSIMCCISSGSLSLILL
jgi:hypothetical protein